MANLLGTGIVRMHRGEQGAAIGAARLGLMAAAAAAAGAPADG